MIRMPMAMATLIPATTTAVADITVAIGVDAAVGDITTEAGVVADTLADSVGAKRSVVAVDSTVAAVTQVVVTAADTAKVHLNSLEFSPPLRFGINLRPPAERWSV